MAAADQRHTDVMELLLANGADANARTSLGETVLMAAAGQGHRDVVELLLTNHAEVNAKAVGDLTALHMAAANGDKDTVELLLVRGADVNAKDINGHTPLDTAAEKHHTEAVELLSNPSPKAIAPAAQIKEPGQLRTALNPQTGKSGNHYWKLLGLSLLVAIGLAILAAFAIKLRSRWEAGGSQQPDRKTTPRLVNDPLPDASVDEWFYSDGEHSIGPFTKDRIRALYTAGVINDNTPLCKGEFEQWTSFKDSLNGA